MGGARFRVEELKSEPYLTLQVLPFNFGQRTRTRNERGTRQKSNGHDLGANQFHRRIYRMARGGRHTATARRRRRQVVRAAATASHAVVRRRPAAGEPLALLLLWVAVLARNSQTMDGSVSGAEGGQSNGSRAAVTKAFWQKPTPTDSTHWAKIPLHWSCPKFRVPACEAN